MKVCSKCGESKELACFSKRKDAPDGLRHECRACHANRSRIVYSNNRERHHELGKRWKRNNPDRIMLIQAKARAAKKGVPFSLKPGDFSVPDRCPVFGSALVKGSNRAGPDSPSLDRIVPEFGYVAAPHNNVSVICNRANTIKGDATAVESAKIALYQAQNQADYIAYLESELKKARRQIEGWTDGLSSSHSIDK
jgi:hypothetical protein